MKDNTLVSYAAVLAITWFIGGQAAVHDAIQWLGILGGIGIVLVTLFILYVRHEEKKENELWHEQLRQNDMRHRLLPVQAALDQLKRRAR